MQQRATAKAKRAKAALRQAPVERVERWPIDKLLPYARNPKTHPPAHVDLIAKSMARFGQAQLVLVDGDEGPAKGEVIVGHGRVLAAQQLGWTELMVGEAVGWSEDEKKAYRIADNQLGSELLAPWNMDLLKIELGDLNIAGFDMPVIGFSLPQLSSLLDRPDPDVDPDEIPDPLPAAVSRFGERWTLGSHTLMCGDSADANQVDQLLAGAKIHLVNTDPPYNVKVEPRSNNAIAAGLSSYGDISHHQGFDLNRYPSKKNARGTMRPKDRPLANDFITDELFAGMLRSWFGNISRVLIPGGTFYIWAGYSNYANYPPALVESKLYFSQGIIWVKEHPILTRKDFMGNHECCFYGWKEGAGHRWFGPTNVPDVWPIKKIASQHMEHLTEKPVELATRAITYSSQLGENILDLFGGSGSTLIAAEQVGGRTVYTMEIDPQYCDIILMRWQNFTGKKAILDGDGRDFDTIKSERLRSDGRRDEVVRGSVPRDPGANGKRRSAVGAKRKGRPKGGPSVAEVAKP